MARWLWSVPNTPQSCPPRWADACPGIGTGPVWIDSAGATTDGARRKVLYTQLRAIVRDEAAIALLHHEMLDYLMTKKVSGSQVTPTLERILGRVWFSTNGDQAGSPRGAFAGGRLAPVSIQRA